jgi:hypothetical protein
LDVLCRKGGIRGARYPVYLPVRILRLMGLQRRVAGGQVNLLLGRGLPSPSCLLFVDILNHLCVGQYRELDHRQCHAERARRRAGWNTEPLAVQSRFLTGNPIRSSHAPRVAKRGCYVSVWDAVYLRATRTTYRPSCNMRWLIQPVRPSIVTACQSSSSAVTASAQLSWTSVPAA